MHLVTVRAQNHEVADVVVAAATIEMSHFQDSRYPESTVDPNKLIVCESEFALVDGSIDISL